MAFKDRGILGITSLILLAGSIVLIFFVVLSGVTGSTPLDKTYFLKADTSSIAGSGRATSQWTYFYVCGEGNSDCGSPVPALPIGYAWVGGTDGVPSALTGHHAKHTTSGYYYYMWRFGWVFYLMGLVFDVLGFFAAIAAPFSRLASGFGGLLVLSGLFFFSIGVTLMSAVFVKARNHFRNNGIDAHVGSYAFGFSWGAWTCLLIATVLLFVGAGIGGRSTEPVVATSSATSIKAASNPKSSRGFFRRQRGRRAGSIGVDSESQRRVKEEY